MLLIFLILNTFLSSLIPSSFSLFSKSYYISLNQILFPFSLTLSNFSMYLFYFSLIVIHTLSIFLSYSLSFTRTYSLSLVQHFISLFISFTLSLSHTLAPSAKIEMNYLCWNFLAANFMHIMFVCIIYI